MAEEKNKVAEEDEKTNSKSGSRLKLIIIVVVLAIVVVGGAVGTTIFFLGGDKTTVAEKTVTAKTDGKNATGSTANQPVEAKVVPDVDKGPVLYQSLDPKFVVSFANPNGVRFMQFSVDVATHQKDVVEQIKLHMPAIRSNLLMIFGDQDSSKVSTSKGKEKLLGEIRDSVNDTLLQMEGKDAIKNGVEAAYFNSFVMQ